MSPPTTILAATDFSPLAEVAVEVAFSLARRTGARVHLVHVLEPIAPVYPYGFPERQLEAIGADRRKEGHRQARGDR